MLSQKRAFSSGGSFFLPEFHDQLVSRCKQTTHKGFVRHNKPIKYWGLLPCFITITKMRHLYHPTHKTWRMRHRLAILPCSYHQRWLWQDLTREIGTSGCAAFGILNRLRQHLKALVFLYAFEESVDCHLLSSFCDDSKLHISLFKYVLSTMGVSKESISKFLIGNRFHVKLRILSPDNCKQSLRVKSWKAEVTAEKKKQTQDYNQNFVTQAYKS